MVFSTTMNCMPFFVCNFTTSYSRLYRCTRPKKINKLIQNMNGNVSIIYFGDFIVVPVILNPCTRIIHRRWVYDIYTNIILYIYILYEAHANMS